MKFRFLGDTGVQVSELALGSWLTYGAAVGISQTRACVKAAFDLGINLPATFTPTDAQNRRSAGF